MLAILAMAESRKEPSEGSNSIARNQKAEGLSILAMPPPVIASRQHEGIDSHPVEYHVECRHAPLICLLPARHGALSELAVHINSGHVHVLGAQCTRGWDLLHLISHAASDSSSARMLVE